MLLSCCDHFDKRRNCKSKHSDTILSKNSNESIMTKDIEQTVDKIENENCETNTGKDKCFLCLNDANNHCVKCSLPFCCDAHYQLHTTSDENIIKGAAKSSYCFPFRVLERPEVRIYIKHMNYKKQSLCKCQIIKH